MIISKLVCERCCREIKSPVFINIKTPTTGGEINKDIILCSTCCDKLQRSFYETGCHQRPEPNNRECFRRI